MLFRSVAQQSSKHLNIETLDYKLKTGIADTSNSYDNTCAHLDENDELQIIENTFYNLFKYNEYINDTFNTNKTIHYELFLKNAGFMLSSVGEPNKMNKKNKRALSEVTQMIDEKLFNEFLLADSQTRIEEDKFKQLILNINYLNLPLHENTVLSEYKDIKIGRAHV